MSWICLQTRMNCDDVCMQLRGRRQTFTPHRIDTTPSRRKLQSYHSSIFMFAVLPCSSKRKSCLPNAIRQPHSLRGVPTLGLAHQALLHTAMSVTVKQELRLHTCYSCRMAVRQGTLAPQASPTRLLIFGADHGVAMAHSVSAYPSSGASHLPPSYLCRVRRCP